MDSLQVTWHTRYPHDIRSGRAFSGALEARSSSFSSIIPEVSVDSGLILT